MKEMSLPNCPICGTLMKPHETNNAFFVCRNLATDPGDNKHCGEYLISTHFYYSNGKSEKEEIVPKKLEQQ